MFRRLPCSLRHIQDRIYLLTNQVILLLSSQSVNWEGRVRCSCWSHLWFVVICSIGNKCMWWNEDVFEWTFLCSVASRVLDYNSERSVDCGCKSKNKNSALFFWGWGEWEDADLRNTTGNRVNLAVKATCHTACDLDIYMIWQTIWLTIYRFSSY